MNWFWCYSNDAPSNCLSVCVHMQQKQNEAVGQVKSSFASDAVYQDQTHKMQYAAL